jgi:ABC-2 type transport system permease protein
MKRVIAQARKELTQTLRDRLTLVLALVLPVILMSLLGSAISLTVTGIKVVVQNFDGTPLSRRYIDAVNASRTFRVIESKLLEKPEQALSAERCRVVITIPEGFEREFTRGRVAEAQWLVDAVDANTANVVRGQAEALTNSMVADFGNSPTHSAIKPEIRKWYNPGADSQKFIGPGALGVVLALFPPLLAALAVSKEGDQKTILQVYVSSISAPEFLLGKIAAFLAIAIAEFALAVSVAMPLFGLKFAGDPTPLLVGAFFYLFCSVAFGVLVGVAVPNQAAAIQAVAGVQFLLSFLLSGFIFPVENIPVAIRWISTVVPARYFIELTRDAFVRGGGWAGVWHAPLVLALIGSVYFLAAWRKMRRMQVII